MGCCSSKQVDEDPECPAVQKIRTGSCQDVQDFDESCVPEDLVVLPLDSAPVGPELDAQIAQNGKNDGYVFERCVLADCLFMYGLTCVVWAYIDLDTATCCQR